ncbi:hypothetical protein [Qipengyuania flava]|uniref:hypothetical protein n=1 Tax=Qipengyuania flava TaxID=192812 RepID=UPI001C62BBB1|nr:hypothetical protein [Qipengyuania flava]QYJ06165.1 hypothetical protein KUV82_08675 [Qipengyuania flava]
MRTLVTLAALATLTACGSEAAEDAAPDTTEAGEEITLGSTAMGDIAGTYEITLSDGSVALQTINEDGTYADTTSDGTRTGGGTWRVGDAGAMCFDPEGDDPEECYAGGEPGENGAFEVLGSDGSVTSSVRKIEADEGAEAEEPAEEAETAPGQ